MTDDEKRAEVRLLLYAIGKLESRVFELLPEHGYLFHPKDCPLGDATDRKSDHYWNSAQEFSAGCWGWTCEYCGTEDEE